MKNRSVLVTGGAGFIGSNFIPYFLEKNPTTKVINLDKLTYAGELSNLKEVENNPNYSFVKGDICDRSLNINLMALYILLQSLMLIIQLITQVHL